VKKPSPGFSADLQGLRDGTLRFDAFARRHGPVMRRWALWFFARWPQRYLDPDDLVQEALIAAWRAVDSYDPDRGKTLLEYVQWQVGDRIRTELQRVLGWPKKSRGTHPVRPVDITEDHLLALVQAPRAEEIGILRQVAGSLDGIERDVVVGVGLGMSIPTVAARLYEDPEAREAYGLRTRRVAGMLARSAALRAEERIRASEFVAGAVDELMAEAVVA
jgi:RNA polymerase sigma factor (sigma-70 family)